MFANTGFVEYTLPAFITNVNVEGVFANCAKLTNVIIGHDVGNTLGVKFFMNCTAMTSYKIPDSIDRLCELVPTGQDSQVLTGTYHNNVVFGYDTSSPSYAFAGCTSLVSINLNKAALIGAHAFDGCTSLTTITFPSSLGMIGDYAFANCTSLESINLSSVSAWTDNRTYQMAYIDIGRYAFAYCSNLTTVKLKTSNTPYGTLHDGAFAYCTKIAEIRWVMSKSTLYGEAKLGDPFIGWTENQTHN